MMANKSNSVIYTGVTTDLQRRVWQHKGGLGSKFTRKYKATKLVYFEAFGDIRYAIARETQIKAGSRRKKIELIESTNGEWRDLAGKLWP
jgi:putative endonuclease